jgi:hypothetical protein
VVDTGAVESGPLHPDIELLVQELRTRAAGASLPPSVEQLAAELYRWYTNCTPGPADAPDVGVPRPQDLDLVAALRAAHAATATLEGGWRATSVSSRGRVVGERDGRQRLFDRIDYLAPGRAGEAARPGDPIFVTRRVDWIDEPSAFWYTQFGNWPPPAIDRIVRVYLNADSSQLPAVVTRLSALMVGKDTAPSIMKVQVGSQGADRADTIVAYFSPDGFRQMETRLMFEIERLAPRLRAPRPRCTRSLGLGAGCAEGRADGASFGEELSSLVAKVFCSMVHAERRHVALLRRAVGAALRDADRDPRAPYLLSLVRPHG